MNRLGGVGQLVYIFVISGVCHVVIRIPGMRLLILFVTIAEIEVLADNSGGISGTVVARWTAGQQVE